MTEETVTTAEASPAPIAELAYSDPITADTIKVTFNGVEYICNKQLIYGGAYYGATLGETGVDWSFYPFAIYSGGGQNAFVTETAGTYRVKIESFGANVETSDCFKKAVQSVTGVFMVNDASTLGGGRLDKTYAEIEEAFLSGRKVLVRKNGFYQAVVEVGGDISLIVSTTTNTYTAIEPTDHPSYSTGSTPIQ